MKRIKCLTKIRKRTSGMVLACAFVILNGSFTPVHAAPDTTIVQEAETGDGVPEQGQAEIDVDGKLKHKSEEETTATRPSATVTGNGLNDKLAGNAKTGDLLNRRTIIVFVAGCGALVLVIVKRKKRTTLRE